MSKFDEFMTMAGREILSHPEDRAVAIMGKVDREMVDESITQEEREWLYTILIDDYAGPIIAARKKAIEDFKTAAKLLRKEKKHETGGL